MNEVCVPIHKLSNIIWIEEVVSECAKLEQSLSQNKPASSQVDVASRDTVQGQLLVTVACFHPERIRNLCLWDLRTVH